ncbi:MAG TPA: hypothetical protein VL404_01170 [Candidatus Eisenbacteria bacterium]|nr:hypothetical protein [Candidatus Eisenbacteria bacterium]
MSEESRKALVMGAAALPVMIVVAALWLLSASWFLPVEYLPELSSWGRQFVLFGQFGSWSVLVSALMLTAEGSYLRRVSGLGISWSLLAVFAANLGASFLGLCLQRRAPALFSALPQSPPLSYLALAPGFLFVSAVQALFFLPLLFVKKTTPRLFLAEIGKMSLRGQAVVLAGMTAVDLPRLLGWR